MKRLFVTGGSGLLGSNIIKIAPESFDSYGSYYKNKVSFNNCPCKLEKIDLTNKNQIKLINNLKPDLIIHCAAYVDVDGCEKDPDKAYLYNVIATENIVRICEEIGSFLIHISTDSVFDGFKGNYTEKDKTNPVNVYGKTKLQSEKIIQKSKIDYCIVRTNIYGWNKRNKYSIAEWMMSVLEKGEKLNTFYDAIFTPIIVNNLSRALFEIYKENIQGLLHVFGCESCTKFDFANTIADVFGYDKNLINKSSVDDLKLTAKRGKNLSMNTEKAQSLLKTKLLNVRDGLMEMKELKENGYVKELKEP